MRGRVLPLARRQQTPNNFSLQAPRLGFAGDLNLDRALGDITGVGTRLQLPGNRTCKPVRRTTKPRIAHLPAQYSFSIIHYPPLCPGYPRKDMNPYANFPPFPGFGRTFGK